MNDPMKLETYKK